MGKKVMKKAIAGLIIVSIFVVIFFYQLKNINTMNANAIKKEAGTATKLVNLITSSDYGKSINYTATVRKMYTSEKTKVSNWQVLYNDGSHIYIILDDYLPNNLAPSGFIKGGNDYLVYGSSSIDLVNMLKIPFYWSEFANGISGSTATGGPSYNILMRSYNEKYGESANTDPKVCRTTGIGGFIQRHTWMEKASLYWIADSYPDNDQYVWALNSENRIVQRMLL